MIYKRHFFSMFLFFSIITLCVSTTNSYYFSNYEVFKIIKNNDVVSFDQWMRTYPNVNIFNKHGQTPLMIAAKMHHNYFINCLMNAGAYKHYIDNFGYTAHDYAREADRFYAQSTQHSDTSNNALTALGVGVAAGILTYGICELLGGSDVSVSYSYSSSPDYYADNYCTKCDRYIHYTKDRERLYCNNCYLDYCNRRHW